MEFKNHESGKFFTLFPPCCSDSYSEHGTRVGPKPVRCAQPWEDRAGLYDAIHRHYREFCPVQISLSPSWWYRLSPAQLRLQDESRRLTRKIQRDCQRRSVGHSRVDKACVEPGLSLPVCHTVLMQWRIEKAIAANPTHSPVPFRTSTAGRLPASKLSRPTSWPCVAKQAIYPIKAAQLCY